MESHFYPVNITWGHDRKGLMCSPEITTPNDTCGCIEVATPPQFSKGISGIWSPEHLFTAAVSSCLMTTFLAVAESSKLAFQAFTCSSLGKLEKKDGKFLMTEVILNPKVTIFNEGDCEKAIRILQKSENICLISRSINSHISMNATIEVYQPIATDKDEAQEKSP